MDTCWKHFIQIYTHNPAELPIIINLNPYTLCLTENIFCASSNDKFDGGMINKDTVQSELTLIK